MDNNLLSYTEGPELVDESPGIDYTRPLADYPNSERVAELLMQDRKKRNIPTESLNVNGTAIQDAMETYLGANAIQSSHFKAALNTPLHFKFARSDERKQIEKLQGEKEYFKIGTFLHECLLEPTKFSRVVVEPKYSRASKEGVYTGIEFWEKQCSPEQIKEAETNLEKSGLSISKQDGKKFYLDELIMLSGKQSLDEEQYLKTQILKKHYENYGGGILKKILHHSKREISFYGNADGLPVKVRPDAIQFEENIGVNAVISVKSTGITDLRGFFTHAAKLHYDLSEGMYQDVISRVTGRDFKTTITVMLQTNEPYGIAILVWSAEDIEMGKYKYRTALEIVKKSEALGVYKGYDSFSENGFGLIDMKLPQWNNKEFLPQDI